MNKVRGVGGVIVSPQGRGTVKLASRIDGKDFIIILHNVLYIPGNRHNLISLGKWDKGGGTWEGGNGEMHMINEGRRVAHGKLIDTNLYQMSVRALKVEKDKERDGPIVHETNAIVKKGVCWEV